MVLLEFFRVFCAIYKFDLLFGKDKKPEDKEEFDFFLQLSKFEIEISAS